MFKALRFAIACAALAHFVTPATAFERLSEAAFQAGVVGKTLAYKRGGQLRFGPSGALTGSFPAGPATGSWYWNNGKVCSQVSIGSKKYPPTCRAPEVEGNKIRFVQDGGKVYGEAIIE